MRCPHCRHETRERARFCGACGASLESSIACPRCAALNPRGQKFCDTCGESLSPGVGAPYEVIGLIWHEGNADEALLCRRIAAKAAPTRDEPTTRDRTWWSTGWRA